MPLPAWQTFQPAAFLLTLLAALLLFKLKRGIVTTLVVCAVAGWLIGSF
jgi:chromate transporter